MNDFTKALREAAAQIEDISSDPARHTVRQVLLSCAEVIDDQDRRIAELELKLAASGGGQGRS